VSAADDLAAVIGARDEHGASRFSGAEIERFLAFVLFGAGVPRDSLPDDAVAFLGAYAVAIGIPPDASRAELGKLLDEHFQKEPVRPELIAAFRRTAERIGDVGEAARTTTRVIGGAVSSRPLGGGERPAGTTAGGPLARFLVDKS
jgi:hypothetical protein